MDEKGKAVPNAEVRLAVGGASRGKAVRALTDESGAFSLNGLRQGVPYTVIAERAVGREVLTGRADAIAPGKGVRITLSADEATSPRADASADDTPGRINRVSGRGEDEQEGADDPTDRPRINAEDLPPAAEAAEFGSDEPPPARKPKDAAPSPASGWRRGAGTMATSPVDASAATDDQPPALAEGPDAHARDESPEAIAPSEATSPRTTEPAAPKPEPLPEPPAKALAAAPQPASVLPDLGDPPADRPDPIVEPKPETPSPEPTPADPAPKAETPAPDAEPEAAPPIAEGPPNLTDLGPLDPPAAPVRSPKPLKWGELSAKTGAQFSPIDPKASRTRPEVAPAASTTPASGVGAEKATAEYDARRQQLLDFRLTDLQGKPVRFKDLGADLVLLDFWGSWCGPCLQAIPHLVALQEKYGDRVKVVGVAYEEGTTAQRIAAVEVVAARPWASRIPCCWGGRGRLPAPVGLPRPGVSDHDPARSPGPYPLARPGGGHRHARQARPRDRLQGQGRHRTPLTPH